ncbi:MAG: hypothetical protein WHV67_04785 [Thermoanaerobaculia bacterium]
MKTLFLIFIFSSLLFSEHNIPFCKPAGEFCIKIEGLPDEVYENEYIRFWVSIKNISGKDFKDGEVKFYVSIGVLSGTLRCTKYKKDDYVEKEWDGREHFTCKEWKNGEERQIEFEILNFDMIYPNKYDYNSAIRYLPRPNFILIYFRYQHIQALHQFYVKTYPPNYLTGIEIDVEGPDIVVSEKEEIFKFKIKNKTNTTFKSKGDYPKLTAIFGRRDFQGIDVSSFEILDKYPNNEVTIKTRDEIFNTYEGYYILEMPIGNFPPEAEAYLTLKIKYRKDEYAYHSYYYLISPLACYFSHIKTDENDYTIRTSSGKGIWVYHPPEDESIQIFMDKEIFLPKYDY